MNPYIQFLNLLRGISNLEKFPRMTPLSKLIFDQIALHEHKSKPLTVRELLAFKDIASSATVHKHLSFLRSSGYVSTITDENDKRTKYLVLAPLGHAYTSSLSKAIKQAAAYAL